MQRESDPMADRPQSEVRVAPSEGGWLSFTAWVMLGMALATLELFAWIRSNEFHQLQWHISSSWYGVPYEQAPWYLKVDGHIHVITMLTLARWLGWGRRLWDLRIAWWWPLLVASATGLTDELIQAASPLRAFEWGDLACDLIGVTIAGAIEVVIHLHNRMRHRRGDA